MHRSQSPTQRHNESQQGSIVVILAASIGMLMVLLASVQIGYNAYVKRELQKTADMAALSGVQALTAGDTACQTAKANASALAALNLPGIDGQNIECGNWKPDNGTGELDNFQASTPYNALQVTVQKQPSLLIPFIASNSPASASAIATNSDPMAAFSVSSRLLNVSADGLIGNLLQTIGLDSDLLTVLDQGGLINAHLTPSGLLSELQLIDSDISLTTGTRDELLGLAPVNVADLVLASANLLDKSGALAADVDALKLIAAKIREKDLTAKLFGDGSAEHPGVLVLDTLDPTSALNTNVRLSGLIASSILVANGDHAVDIPFTELDTGLIDVGAKAYVVAPPTIAVGGEGTSARNAQAYVDLYVKETAVTGLNLRIMLELAQSEAVLDSINCQAAPQHSNASFSVTTDLSKLCFVPPNAPDGYRCENNDPTTNVELLNLLGIIPINVPLEKNLLPIIQGSESPVILKEPPGTPSSQTVGASDLSLTELVRAVLNTLLGGIVNSILNINAGAPALTNTSKHQMATDLMSQNNNNIDQVGDQINATKDRLDEIQQDSSGLVSGLLKNTVGSLVSTLGTIVNGLGNLVEGLLDGIFCGILGIGCDEPSLADKINGVQKQVFGTNTQQARSGLATVVVTLLTPLLTPLESALSTTFDTLGLNLAQSDLALQSVQCGLPRLVK